MGFFWMLLVTAPFYLALTTAQNSEELYLFRNPSGNELTCMSEDDDAALVWNYDLSTNESRDGFNDFKPAKPMNKNDPQCAVWGSTGGCLAAWKRSDDWVKVNSLAEPMGPVVDYRWEGFEEEVWSKYSLCSEGNLRSTDGTVVFSVRGTRDIHVRLCDFESSWCLVVTIAITSPNSTIQNCRSRQSYAQSGKNQACQLINSTKHETPIPDAHEWRTFRFQWMSNAYAIKVFRGTEKEEFLQGQLREWHRVCNIGIESAAGARIKLHAYDYIHMKSVSGTLTTDEFFWQDRHFCIDMLVSLCPQCRMDVSLMSSGRSEELAKESTFAVRNFGSDKLKIWQSIKLNMNLRSPTSTGMKLEITFHVFGNDYRGVWWAIDNLRICKQDNCMRESTIQLPPNQKKVGRNIKCQKLSHSKILSVDSSTSESVSEYCKFLQDRKQSCIPKDITLSEFDCNSTNRTYHRGPKPSVTTEGLDNYSLEQSTRKSNVAELERNTNSMILNNIWFVIIPIVAILLLLLSIWYWRHRKTRVQRRIPRDDLFDPVYTVPDNWSKQMRDARDVPALTPVYAIPVDYSRQTSRTRDVSSDLSRTYISDSSEEEISYANDVPLNTVYANIPADLRDQTSQSQDFTSDLIYEKISDISREQMSYSQDASSNPVYYTTGPDNSLEQTNYSENDPLNPLYAEIDLNNSR